MHTILNKGNNENDLSTYFKDNVKAATYIAYVLQLSNTKILLNTNNIKIQEDIQKYAK